MSGNAATDELFDAVDNMCTELRVAESNIRCSRCGSTGCRDHGGAFDREIHRAQNAVQVIEDALEQDEWPLPIALVTWRLLLTAPQFGPEAGPGDQDTLSSIVDHCDEREHAQSVAWHMAHARADRDALVSLAGDQWDHVDDIAGEQAAEHGETTP